MEIAEKFLECINREKVDILLYGAGKYGRIALKNLNNSKIKVKYFVDDDLKRNNTDIEGIPVISFEKAISECQDSFIVISNYYIKETVEKIERAGIDLSKVFFSNELLIESVEKTYLHEKRNELSKVYNFLGDYESKIIYKTIVESRLTHNIDVLSRTCSNNQYFPIDIIQLNENEIFVDGGAFDGDTIRNFLNITQGKYKYIYAFEPDYQNYTKLYTNTSSENIKLFNMGLYNEDTTVTFSSGKGGSSTISGEGRDKINVCSFDKLNLIDKKVSFIKMDIEGSELAALQGMKETICKNKPKLAICIYHKFEDLWEIPLYIKMLVPEYKFYIRNYTTYLDEIVLYAIL